MKRVFRSRNGRLLGVCKGIADYLEVDVTVIRLGAVALFFLNPLTIMMYLVAALILEKEA